MRGPAGILQLNIGLYCNQVFTLSALVLASHVVKGCERLTT